MSRMDMAEWPGRTHAYVQVPGLYPFGHGLSYTTFTTTSIRPVLDGQGGTSGFHMDVQNSGEVLPHQFSEGRAACLLFGLCSS